jgi:hypothetical protein
MSDLPTCAWVPEKGSREGFQNGPGSTVPPGQFASIGTMSGTGIDPPRSPMQRPCDLMDDRPLNRGAGLLDRGLSPLGESASDACVNREATSA